MNKRYIFLFLLFITTTFHVKAQPFMTLEDMPYVGYEHVVATQTNPSVDIGIASATEQTWDFSNLQASAYDTVRFVDPAITPAGVSFPSSNMARSGSLPSLLGIGLGDLIPLPLDLFPGTAYYTKNADGKIYNNGVFTNINIPGLIDLGEQNLAADPADLFLAPLAFNESISNQGQFELVYNLENDTLPIPIPVTLRVSLNKTITADAYGNLQLPDETYSVLRYNEDIVADIFVGVEVFGIPIQSFVDTTINFNIFRFLSKGQNYPVATVTISPDGTGEPSPLSIEYFDELGPIAASFDFTTSCLTGYFTNNSANALAYNWNFGDGSAGSSAASPSYQFTQPGTYSVTLQAFGVNGTVATQTQEVTVDYCSGIDATSANEVNIYPSITTGLVQINAPNLLPNCTLSVYNTIGQKVLAKSFTSNTIDLSNLPNGTYYITLSNPQKIVATQMVVKQ